MNRSSCYSCPEDRLGPAVRSALATALLGFVDPARRDRLLAHVAAGAA